MNPVLDAGGIIQQEHIGKRAEEGKRLIGKAQAKAEESGKA